MKEEWKIRGEVELNELRTRIRKLEWAIKNERANISPDHVNLMESQLIHMKTYASLLNRRLNG